MAAKPEAWRLFVAITVPDSVKAELARAQRELQEALPRGGVRWTKPEGFHLTLKFLGNVAAHRTDELEQALRVRCGNFPALQLRADQIGFFPTVHRPRVVWAGVRDRAEILPRLQRAIEESVANFTDEKPEAGFIGHVTLGRCPRIHRSEVELLSSLASRWNRSASFGEWTANGFELIRSELASGGSRYTTLSVLKLSQER